MNEQQNFETVRELVAEDLEGRFGDEFAFSPILVETRIDYWGDGKEYFLVSIVFDGDQRNLDPHWTGGLVMRILPEMRKRGIEAWPVPRFIAKSEWDAHERKESRKRTSVAAGR